MSPQSQDLRRRRNLLPDGVACGRLVRIALAVPLLALLLAVVALVVYCRGLLHDAAAGRPVVIGDTPLSVFVVGFLVASAAVVVAQSLRLASRVAGPEYRLCQTLQRIRRGESGFRVKLRRGDLLTGLAGECNELLEWLERKKPVADSGDRAALQEAPRENATTPAAPELAEVAP